MEETKVKPGENNCKYITENKGDKKKSHKHTYASTHTYTLKLE